jgi:hypothetical protein
MVTIVKSEWHSVERRYGFDVDEALLEEIYPDLKKKEIKQMLKDLKSGEISPDEIVEAAYDNGVDMDWDWLDEDDWWTDRKGGYDVTYQLGE